jgi:nickel-dependent lactate racemase
MNVILNGEKQVVSAVFGSPRAVMAAGIPLSRPVCQVQAREKFDLVFAAVGGAPKDINFYQSQKALTHASQFTRDGGMIVLAAACPEGTGSRSYEEFMHGLDSPEAVFAKFRTEGFQVGPHKAFQVARIAARLRIVLVSEMPAALVQRLLMTPAATLSVAVEQAAAYFTPTPLSSLRIAVLPRATNTILSAA